MSNIRINPQDVRSLAQRMHSWERQMQTMRQSVVSGGNNIRSSWSDPQYEMFINQLDAISKGLDSYMTQLRDSAKILEDMARQMEREAQDFRQRQSRIRNR